MTGVPRNVLGGLSEDWDAAKRMSDTVALHLVAATDLFDVIGKWCVFALRDGRSDNVVYDTKDDAVRHTRYSKDHCYLKITPDGITQKDALRFLYVNRHPMIDTTAPEHVHNFSVYPQFSNLTPTQRQTALRIENEMRKRHASGE